MIHRFATFEIDAAARELRAGGRVLDLQPRVFALLLYLAQNRDRVVPKDELLDAVWPGVIVADGSLQRAVSYARSALADAGVVNAIRTFSRTGYRLCAEEAEQPNGLTPPAASVSPSPARQLAERALKLMARPNPPREAFETAAQLIEQAKSLDPADAEVWAVGAQADFWHVFYLFDDSESRRERARSGAMRALAIDPHSYEARLAQSCVLITIVAQPAARAEAEALLREMIHERSDEPRALEMLANLLRNDDRCDEAAFLFERAGSYNAAGWAFAMAGRLDEAMAIADRLVTADPTVANLDLKASIETWGLEDLDAAEATVNRLPASALLEDYPGSLAAFIHLYRGDPEKVLETLRAIPRDWLASGIFAGPKGWLSGRAHQLAGRTIAAQAEWGGALACVEQRLAKEGNSPHLLRWRSLLLALMGEKEEAGRILDLEHQLAGRSPTGFFDQYAAEAGLLIGRQEAVMTWLEDLLRHPLSRLWFVHAVARFDPGFAPLHQVPRCAALLRKMLPADAKPFRSPNELKP